MSPRDSDAFVACPASCTSFVAGEALAEVVEGALFREMLDFETSTLLVSVAGR